MTVHPIQWQAPQPLWSRFGATTAGAAQADDQSRPAILRFASDDFMDQVIGTLANAPAQLGELLARPETWRTPAAAASQDLVERVAVPRVAQAAARGLALLRPKSRLAAVADVKAISEQAQPRDLPLKLYQPAHQRFYLVSASLVCRLAGLPERGVVQGGSEQLGFVLRRLLPETAGSTAGDTALREFAWVKDAQGARWRRVAEAADAQALAPGEELLPVFPLAFSDDAARVRTLWTGLVPVARREQYLGAPVDRSVLSLASAQLGVFAPPPAAAAAPSKLARLTQFKLEVAEPWKVLVRSAWSQSSSLNDAKPTGLSGGEDPGDKDRRRYRSNLQAQSQSWLILLDFADYIAAYLPDLARAIDGQLDPTALAAPTRSLYDWLGRSGMSAADCRSAMQDPATHADLKVALATMREALRAIGASGVRAGLEGAEKLYGQATQAAPDWPPFHFLLAGLDVANAPAGAYKALNAPTDTAAGDAAEVVAAPLTSMNATQAQAAAEAEQLDRLTALVGRALLAGAEADAPPLPYAVRLAQSLAATKGDPGWFVIRFVYLNRDCGPLHPPTLSAPSQRFQLANFFDSDAPARPVQITLPLDTSPAGLRKHQKNTAFVISDLLCGQIQRAKGLGFVDLVRQVLPWPLHKDIDVGGGGACNNGSVNIGMICSLSIPIVTICALILLLIIVMLLDFIFGWLPYLILCLPVIGLKGKKP